MPNRNPGPSRNHSSINKNRTEEFSEITEKASPVSADLLLIEDSADGHSKKRVQITNLPSGTPADDSITNAKLANMAQDTLKGRASGAGTGDPTDLTATQATAILNAFTSGLKGLAPASGGGTTNFLRADGSWTAPGGGGGGDTITVNGSATAATDVDLDDSTPAPPAGEVNVKWQKDALNPTNVSASVQAATESQKGVAEIATQAEVNARTDDARYVTPLKLASAPRYETFQKVYNGKLATVTDIDGPWVAPYAGEILRVTMWRGIAGSTSGSTTTDVHIEGTTIFTTQSNRPTIAQSAGDDQVNVSGTIQAGTFSQNDKITVDLDAIETNNSQNVALTIHVRLDP